MNPTAMDGAKQLFVDMEATEFWYERFEVEPVFGDAEASLTLSWQEVFDVLPAAYADGAIRFVNEGTSDFGENPARILADLHACASPICAASFMAHFEQGEFSYAVQGFESYCPDVQLIAESLRRATGCAVSVTAFLTPPGSRATRIHYDKNDVFALQVWGEKSWETFQPIDPLPNPRTPNVAVDEGKLIPHQSYRLGQGKLLYLPRGWIHQVENQSAVPSMHFSFVVFANAWVGIFANLMDTAYAALRARPRWRQSISPTITRSDTVEMIDSMLGELRETMLGLAAGHPERYVDHCRNDLLQLHRVAKGKNSIAEASERQDHVIAPTGAQYLLRHDEAAHSIRVSTDGTNFLPVRRSVLETVESGPIQLSAFERMTAGEDQAAAIDALDVLISRLGAFGLSAYDSAGN